MSADVEALVVTQRARRNPLGLTPLEIASGWVAGHDSAPPVPRPTRNQPGPLEALAPVLRAALAAPPCLVAFSGGRDSSIVLAAAARLAREEGHEPPVPVTRTFPRHPQLDERPWQELLVGDLGLADWVRIDSDEHVDLLGPLCTASLERSGLLFPPPVHAMHPMLAAARGGSLLTGEGGDEILGASRGSALRQVSLAHPRAVSPRAVALALAPRPVRRRHLRRVLDLSPLPWLREDAQRAVTTAVVDDLTASPLDWLGSARLLLRRRAWRLGLASFDLVADQEGAQCLHPLMDAGFVGALAPVAGRLGFESRADAMRQLFVDLLPRPLVERRSKPLFTSVVFGAHCRAFAAGWDGEGIDHGLVDAERLRDEWLAAEPSGLSLLQLQAVYTGA